MKASPSSPLIPRHWDTEIEGIRWLPRMIDKARMQESGTLGAYLLGQSPVDKALLKRMRTDTRTFIKIVREAADDASVLAALRKKGCDEASMRRWSARFHEQYKYFIPLWELDEGYAKPNFPQKIGLIFFRIVEKPLMAVVRKCISAP